MGLDMQVFPPGDNRPTVMVVSHERSGTHFLINTLARAFGYMPGAQRLDLDTPPLPINFYAHQNLQGFSAQLAGHNVSNVIKSHHAADFMAPVIDDVVKGARVLYIHRHPADVMHSMWRFLKNLEWREGPDCATPAKLMRTPPEGALMRYQMVQHESMLARWQAHVNGWADLADANQNIEMVRFEDLRDDYAGVVAALGEKVIGVSPSELTPPV